MRPSGSTRVVATINVKVHYRLILRFIIASILRKRVQSVALARDRTSLYSSGCG